MRATTTTRKRSELKMLARHSGLGDAAGPDSTAAPPHRLPGPAAGRRWRRRRRGRTGRPGRRPPARPARRWCCPATDSRSAGSGTADPTSPARVKKPRIAPKTLCQTTRLTAGSESWEMARTRAAIIGTITNGLVAGEFEAGKHSGAFLTGRAGALQAERTGRRLVMSRPSGLYRL